MVWQAGHLLNNGKYEILEVLGRGGFGLTYKARHRQLAMVVVIKTPDILQKRDTEYEDYVKQFEAEGRKLAKFSQTPHPHIVRVWDIFMEGQVPYLVMDFIQGQTLMEKVKAQGKLSEAECLKYIHQIGSALEAVHQAGMVHRDAHPGNIMIQPNGNAILIDFGIAKEIIPASSSSTDYAANPSFAPYEQIYKGSKANRQPSVDIYALAASFYYAVTGQKPTPSMERRLSNRPLKSPKEINPNLSEYISTAITLGMALEKENRPQSMSDWLQQLELPPPAVEPKYWQETINPPRSVNLQKELEAAKQKPKVNRRSAQNSIQEKLKDIPWGWLIGLFLVYGLSGYILGVNSAPWQALAVVVAGSGAVAGNPNMDWAGSVAAALSMTGVIAGSVTFMMAEVHAIKAGTQAMFGTAGWARAGPLVMAGIAASVGTAVEGMAGEKLLKYFSRFHSFLILASTSLSGLGSGWLLGFLLHPKG
ncbi:MAG: serine/threonine protein kinase [Woronichinia naegeliana WA131]|uniref:non-specific serine/threonine protein kinase n=1 Tax=Woronichinia naegeliana WA131 TaxID=2824559 RepID=A0A977PV95_9CYAN|nr:MAG: serine/threonine protein kinase [Woronichinia naegeliana WA131]